MYCSLQILNLQVFFNDFEGVDIHSEKYCINGTSKANKLHEFWTLEEDATVGHAISKMINLAVSQSNSNFSMNDPSATINIKLVQKCRKITQRLLASEINLDGLKNVASIFDAKYLVDQIRRMETAINNDDPASAIGTAKDLIETCCKTILSERKVQVSDTHNIPKLTRETLKELQLIPDNIHKQSKGEDVVRRLLVNLGTIGCNMAEFRGLYGTGHGKEVTTRALEIRHAKLAVGAASTFATFLFETHEATK